MHLLTIPRCRRCCHFGLYRFFHPISPTFPTFFDVSPASSSADRTGCKLRKSITPSGSVNLDYGDQRGNLCDACIEVRRVLYTGPVPQNVNSIRLSTKSRRSTRCRERRRRFAGHWFNPAPRHCGESVAVRLCYVWGNLDLKNRYPVTLRPEPIEASTPPTR